MNIVQIEAVRNFPEAEIANIRQLILEHWPHALKGGASGFINTVLLIGAELGSKRLRALLSEIQREREDPRDGLIYRLSRFRGPLKPRARR